MIWSVIETGFPQDKKTGKRIIVARVETPRDIKGLADALLRLEEIKLKIAGEPDKMEHTGELTVNYVEISDKIAKKMLDESAKEEFEDNGSTSVTD